MNWALHLAPHFHPRLGLAPFTVINVIAPLMFHEEALWVGVSLLAAQDLIVQRPLRMAAGTWLPTQAPLSASPHSL